MALSSCIKPDFTSMITARYQCQQDAHPDGNVYPWIVHTQTICSMEGQIARAFSVKVVDSPPNMLQMDGLQSNNQMIRGSFG